ncbi:hypothetical protein HNP21_005378 [Bacillus aryabhattai]|uniref:Uncharacterized protein n=1 Tax=Priestia aryabhattai TaxID=412384 RepID=A0A7W3RI58_PRIAR|nr:hypothetical protein [Priestia aryabhattai]MBA9042243.1 hypothetical protein [Priestia aryabhattai]MCJ7983316.1 hypothetical protein [Priestia sp. OVL9]MCJ7983392.1 hypothetical protein [Priestia sp. OVL9]
MNDEGFNFKTRTQFKFVTSDYTLGYILSGIAQKGININDYTQTKINVNENLIRLAVEGNGTETIYVLRCVRNIFRMLDIKFSEKDIIKIESIASNTTRQVNTLFGSM